MASKSVFRTLCIFVVLLAASLADVVAQDIVADSVDLQRCALLIQEIDQDTDQNRAVPAIMLETGHELLGTSYEGGTLEQGIREPLVINLTEFDCTTFVESTLAMALTLKQPTPNLKTYQQQLTRIRYRDGKRKGYTSRLHYFLDWIRNNEKKGIVKDMTQSLGGTVSGKTINFMSQNPDYYPFSKNSSLHEMIRFREQKINSIPFYVITPDRYSAIESEIESGDIIGFVSNRNDLDFYHNGLAVWEDGVLRLMHASSTSEKVVVSDQPLLEYAGMDRYGGIVVVRPQTP